MKCNANSRQLAFFYCRRPVRVSAKSPRELFLTEVFPAILAIRGGPLAKPNYQFEKRQRDLAKKKKQEEKRLQKLAGKSATSTGENEAETDNSPETSNPLLSGTESSEA